MTLPQRRKPPLGAAFFLRGRVVGLDAETPRRRWWRKRRSWAAAGVLLLAGYPASFGPACYAYGRGWLPPPVRSKVFALCRPMTDAAATFRAAGS